VRRLGVSPSWLLLTVVFYSPVASAEASQPSSSSDANVVPCAIAGPGSVTAALSCPDRALAMQALDEAGCFLPHSPGATEVRRIWLGRESLAADAAGRDPVVQAFIANCLVESIRDVGAVGPAEASAVSFLRQALNEPSRGLAGIAMAGLSSVLVKDDVATIVRLGSTQATLAIPAIAALSISCISEAKAGVASIRAAHAGTQQQTEIDRFVDGSKELMEHCGREGAASSESFVGKVALPGTRQAVPRSGPPDATQAKAALGSSIDPKALQTLLDVQCTPEHADVVDAMRQAWRGRGTADGGLVSDPVAQAVIARNEVVRIVGFTCGANNLKTLALMRKEAATEQVRDRIDAVYKRIALFREQTCGKGK
jgi:hypothetical protein